MRGLAVAIRFLTRLSVPWPQDHRTDDLARSLPWFPLVGALVGLVIGGVGMALVRLGLHVGLAAAVAAVVVGPLLTGALHEDGLADTADGLGGGRDREAVLRILRDSRVGAYGVLATVAAMLLRVEALQVLPMHQWPLALAAAHALGRLATVRLMATLPYARTEHAGLAAPMVAGLSPLRQALAAALGIGLAVGLAGVAGLIAIGLGLLAVVLLGRWYERRLGGITGDLLGAACVTVEILTLVVLGVG